MIKLKLFAQITKVDQAKRLVYGIAAAEVADRSGEILDYAASKAHFQEWSASVSKDTDGKSLGNLRAMHGKVAAGKLTDLVFNDTAKQVEVCAKVVDDAEWRKVEEGVYTGFSIGGSYVKQWPDATLMKEDGKTPLTRYEARPSELSLVDRPCIPTAKFFQIQKADGSTAQVEFREQTTAELAVSLPIVTKADLDAALEVITEDDASEAVKAHVTERATALGLEKGLPPWLADKVKSKKKTGEEESDEDKKKAAAAEAEKAKEKAAPNEYVVEGTEAEVETLSKFLTAHKLSVGDAHKLLETAVAVARYAAESAEVKKLSDAGELKKGMWEVSQLAKIVAEFDSLRSSVVFEQAREEDVGSALPAKMKQACLLLADLLKAMIVEETGELISGAVKGYASDAPRPMLLMAKSDVFSPLRSLTKAEDPPKYGDRLHALAKEMGAECAAKAATVELTKLLAGEELAKLIATEVEKVTKVQADRIAKLEAQPATPKAILKAVPKGADDPSLGAASKQIVESIINKDGSTNEAATLIKQLHATNAQAYVDVAR